jgi:hypothetical protein
VVLRSETAHQRLAIRPLSNVRNKITPRIAELLHNRGIRPVIRRPRRWTIRYPRDLQQVYWYNMHIFDAISRKKYGHKPYFEFNRAKSPVEKELTAR